MKQTILLCISLLVVSCLSAQDFGYGFKAGLNFNSFKGDSETDLAGNELEEFTSNTGFHVGAMFTWKATELMGFRGEFMFSQKGGDRTYRGPSYYFFSTSTGGRIPARGVREVNLNITNSYLAIPVTAYVRPVKWVEIYAGGSVGFLISSTAFGELTFEGATDNGTAIPEFNHELDFNFYNDKPGEVEYDNPPETIPFGNENLLVPLIAGSQFEFTTDRGSLYRVIQAGAVGGLSVYLSKGLFTSFRVDYGLTDLTKDKADVSLFEVDENDEFITRNDKDKNLSLQVSVGFSF